MEIYGDQEDERSARRRPPEVIQELESITAN